MLFGVCMCVRVCLCACEGPGEEPGDGGVNGGGVREGVEGPGTSRGRAGIVLEENYFFSIRNFAGYFCVKL